jgi:hypothetical protein
MHRFRVFLLASTTSLAVTAAVLALGSGCSDADLADTSTDAAAPKKDSSAVDPAEPGDAIASGTAASGDCTKYCGLVMSNCTGDDAQYASASECLSFCAHLPADSTPTTSEHDAPSLACRQYWADTPARTNPKASCLAAGPFGGNVCGDRCTAFCGVLLDSCHADTADAVYRDQPDCASACAGFQYADAGTDGGGEGPTGPTEGDTLNCRLFHLRAATVDPAKCAALGPAGACQ